MAIKKKAKITITKENYAALKADRMSLKILRDIVGAGGAAKPTAAKLHELRMIEQNVIGMFGTGECTNAPAILQSAYKRMKALIEHEPIINEIADMLIIEDMSHRETKDKLSTIYQVVRSCNKAARDTADYLEVPDHAGIPLYTVLGSIRHTISSNERDHIRERRKLEHRVDRLKQALRSSMHTNTELGAIMGMFEDMPES